MSKRKKRQGNQTPEPETQTVRFDEPMPEGSIPLLDPVFTWLAVCDNCGKEFMLAQHYSRAVGLLDNFAAGKLRCRQCGGQLERKPTQTSIIKP